MISRRPLAAIALATASIGVPAAQAQTLSVTKTATSPYTFTVTVAPSTTINMISFDFNGLVNFNSAGGPLTNLLISSATATDSYYSFYGPGNPPAPQTLGTETFTFTPGTGSTATTYNVAVTGPSFAQTASGLLAAPEPGSLASVALLTACLGLVLVARRKTSIN